MSDPAEIGSDSIVNAAAAFHRYGGPVIIVDFGTATTFCAVTKEGEYLGGAIAPGIGISADALFQRAAKNCQKSSLSAPSPSSGAIPFPACKRESSSGMLVWWTNRHPDAASHRSRLPCLSDPAARGSGGLGITYNPRSHAESYARRACFGLSTEPSLLALERKNTLIIYWLA